MTCGIYCIENIVNGKKYVGKSSTTFERRWYLHKWHLNRGSHGNRYLQNAWKKHGEGNFKFYILAELPNIDFILNTAEIAFIALLKSHHTLDGYNLTFGGEGSSGWIPTEETRTKISKANRGFKQSKEQINKRVSKMSGENHPMYGKPMSTRVKEKLLASHIGIKASAETREKMRNSHKGLLVGEKNPQFGKPRTENAKRKTSEKLHREKHPRFGSKTDGASSQYHGVVFDGRYGTWVTKFTLDGKKIYIGSSKTEMEAAKKYDKYIVEHNLKNPLNFPEDYN